MLLIICEVSSSTLVRGLASHEIERQYNNVGIHRDSKACKEKKSN
jgi:hypothetical protein